MDNTPSKAKITTFIGSPLQIVPIISPLRIFCISKRLYFKSPDKAVILSEALRRSIANRGLYSAESKDPGDACWQMLLGAFRPQTTPEDKNHKLRGSRATAVPLHRHSTPRKAG